MEVFHSKYLTKEALDNLKLYKYGAVDLSPLSKYILQPYWVWCLQFFPMWMAPNLITIIGLSFVVVNVVLVCWLVPDLQSAGPSWLYFSCALGIWLYSTFDNVDGKQARRTGSSSPLGELFDHGCDALNCSFGTIIQTFALGLGYSWSSMYVGFLAICAFFFSTWEEYHTGVMYLGYVNGPTEGLVLSCLTMILSGIYGPTIWKMPLSSLDISMGLPKWLHNITAFEVMAFGMSVLLFVFHIPQSLLAVRRACRAKNTSYTKALSGLWPIILYFGSIALWLGGPDSTILGSSKSILFILMAGFVFGRIAVSFAQLQSSNSISFSN